MKLATLTFQNFRLLCNAALRLDPASSTTILVGPNNSGKTSVAEALELFLGKRRFAVDDFSLDCRDAFVKADAAVRAAAAPAVALPMSPDATPPLADRPETLEDANRAAGPASPAKDKATAAGLPAISVTLEFEYDDTPEDLVVASDLLMDLDADYRRIAVRVTLEAIDPEKTLKAFALEAKPEQSLLEYLRPRFADHYRLTYAKVDPRTGDQEPLEKSPLDRLLKVDCIWAQRHIADQDTGHSTRISKLIHAYYDRCHRMKEPEDTTLAATLERQSGQLTDYYATAFAGLLDDLDRFGYPHGRSPRLSIRAELDAETLFKDNTRVYYRTDVERAPDDPDRTPTNLTVTYDLPEKYNGLGFKNLIYIVLQVTSFREQVALLRPCPRVHLVFIEEPEVHLHPQVQGVFVRQLSLFLQPNETGPDVQVLLTTHSSHIVADSGFAPIRYFRRAGRSIVVKDLLSFRDEAASTPDAEAVRFLAQYLTQTRCDLLFADKAILIEGAAERVLLQRMIGLCATGAFARLRSEFISIVEVGGAYAHLFRPLVEFLAVPTLVVTDLDAVGPDQKAVPVQNGVTTSNATLQKWLPKKRSIADLMAATIAAKVAGRVRVAYEVPERRGQRCGRSFEEAFVYCNADWLAKGHRALAATGHLFAGSSRRELIENAYELSRGSLDKLDFALDLLLAPGWSVPRYIAAGLRWLARQDA